MKFLELEQGSDKWLLFRQVHIMATDAAKIMNKNPWETPKDLWEQKMGLAPPVSVNEAMLRGQRLEPIARALACKEIGVDFTPAVVQNATRPWQAASLDGISEDLAYILEIKCPNNATHDFSVQELGIHNYYRIQMQHQFAVTGCASGYYVSYHPEHTTPLIIIDVVADPEFLPT